MTTSITTVCPDQGWSTLSAITAVAQARAGLTATDAEVCAWYRAKADLHEALAARAATSDEREQQLVFAAAAFERSLTTAPARVELIVLAGGGEADGVPAGSATALAGEVAAYAAQADELAAMVERVIAEERAGGRRARTLAALGVIARALGEQHGELDAAAARIAALSSTNTTERRSS
ncbi:hypothetical protein L6E12_21035 [Actinokineospora sp. PR83]|uniref:hypothetical protein n=1 Tax=Actinokineospora sp. PR83 TaxID=2884908 RepID=UPI001F17BEE0|nr:hypothetical protein [Actinokineospora sp. PR83]MCG8918271.1 hypothetical protein [Actinokineospora sp. PR83]